MTSGAGLTRRALLRASAVLGLAAGGTFAAAAVRGAGAAPAEAPVNRLIQAYDRFGIHRTGSAADRHTTAWLGANIAALGLEAETVPYSFAQVVDVRASLRVGALEIPAFPLLDSCFGDMQPLRGVITADRERGGIVALRAPPHYALPGAEQLAAARRDPRVAAVVAITAAPALGLHPGLSLINADAYLRPYGPPVIQLASTYESAVLRACASAREVELHAAFATREARSANVVCRVPGSRPERAPVVVMTPTTGWWHCASERGGGLALWLRLLHSLAAEPSSRPVLFVATSGHELGHLGLRDLLRTRQPLFADVHAWLHLGAAFCGRDAFTTVQLSSSQLAGDVRAVFAAQGLAPQQYRVAPAQPVGELKEVAARGGHYVSISGVNPYFHNPADRWPQSVDPGAGAAYERAFAQVLARMLV